jgi:hypothetical protein
MLQLRRFLRGRVPAHVAMAVLGFTLGGSTIVFAASSGAIKIEAFNLADGTTPSQLAKVDASGNVAVSVANAPTVSIAGTPTVKVARQPFQQFVYGATTSGSEECDEVVVPAGMRLKVEAFSAEAEESNNSKPSVYLLVTAATANGGNLVRPIGLDLDFTRGRWVGDVQTTLFTGSGLAGDGITYSIHACVVSAVSGDLTSFRGFVSGYLEPLP